ncbi:MAG: SLC13 family permease [Desulfosarcinaceae bacterium]|nr:SLC13 family permease [Desulfosarcinaceae bacterium]
MEIWIVSVILVGALYFLISEKLPVDVTAIGIIALLAITGILSPAEAVAGFANPAVITVGAMFLISRGLIRTGAVEYLSTQVVNVAGGNARSAMLLVLLTAAVSSAFINNTPVVVLFIPVLISMCCRFGESPSQYLITLSYVSILAGTCTLIGTSTNILVSDMSARYGFQALGMFELARLGIPLAVVGLLFLLVAAPRLMPTHNNPACQLNRDGGKRYLAELLIPADSAMVGQTPDAAFNRQHPSIEVIEVIRRQTVYYPDRDRMTLAADDRLLVKGGASDLLRLYETDSTTLPHVTGPMDLTGGAAERITVEAVIPPLSALVGDRLTDTDLLQSDRFHVIAVERGGAHYGERSFREMRLRTGDILLVTLPWVKMDDLRARGDLIVVEEVHQQIVKRHKAGVAALIFAAMVLLASCGVLDILVAAVSAVLLMLVTGCLQMRDAYRSLQGNVLVLIAGTLALGAAMEKTGTSHLYAQYFLGFFEGLPTGFILGSFMVLTSLSTQLLSNNATAVLLMPIAVSTAIGLGVNPKPFIMAVCFGASACFATPIGYQTNLLVYGPGGYRFSDYFKLGMPLNLIIILGGSWWIPKLWPF